MRPHSGLLVAGGAVLLGTLTGVFLLPDRGAVLSGARPTPDVHVTGLAASATPSPTSGASPSRTARPSSATARPTPSQPSATARSRPVTEANLLPVSAFSKAGLKVSVYPQNGNTMPDASVTSCIDERPAGARTLHDITGRNPKVLGTWDEPATTNTAQQVVAEAESPALADTYTQRLVVAEAACQGEPRGHWVYGAVHTEDVAAGSSASWFGRYDGKQNTKGRAPTGVEPCGGVAVVHYGTHFGVLEVLMCADSEQLATLARAAARQLG